MIDVEEKSHALKRPCLSAKYYSFATFASDI